MSILPAILLLILLLIINAYFVTTEFALVSSRHDRLEAMAAAGHTRAYKVIDASEHLSMMLATCQLGITIASVLIGKIAEPTITRLIEKPFSLIGVSGFGFADLIQKLGHRHRLVVMALDADRRADAGACLYLHARRADRPRRRCDLVCHADRGVRIDDGDFHVLLHLICILDNINC